MSSAVGGPFLRARPPASLTSMSSRAGSARKLARKVERSRKLWNGSTQCAYTTSVAWCGMLTCPPGPASASTRRIPSQKPSMRVDQRSASAADSLSFPGAICTPSSFSRCASSRKVLGRPWSSHAERIERMFASSHLHTSTMKVPMTREARDWTAIAWRSASTGNSPALLPPRASSAPQLASTCATGEEKAPSTSSSTCSSAERRREAVNTSMMAMRMRRGR
mmetsp:Transcript_13350/g.40472  ORF Transcript_13350/g.40472 Transcript_13350/m.40472 type:complete len:222 (-) Transcript_13350:123-788(-)